jgi:HEAT repeat protein
VLSGKCLADAEFIDPTLKEKIVRDLWNLYDTGEFQLLKEKAIAVLSRLNPPDIIHFALGRIKKNGAVPYLTEVFNAHKEGLIRGNAAYALGEIGGVDSIPFLIQALTTDKDNYVRCRAAEALGNTGNIMSIPPLKIALSDEGSYNGWKVKHRAFEALEKVSQRLQVKIFKDEKPIP